MAKSGAARVYFDVVGRFSSERLLGDTQAAATVQKAILIDTLGGINDSFMETTNQILMGVASMTDAFFEFEQQFVRVRKFYNSESVDEVNRFAEAAVKMGEGFAFTGAEALAASARTAQLKGVLGQQEAVIEAARAGLLMAQIGEMETEEGMNRFIQLAQQTQFLYGGMTKAQYDALDAQKQANVVRESSIHTLNQLNTIENSSVATMEDITFVLNQFASQADIAGESIGEMAAMSALLLETGEEVSRAGTGLRMIYQRLGNANNNATKAIAELVEGVDAQGVAQMKLTDVLRAISPAYAQMNSEQKRALAVNIAGSRHYIKFLKLMENQTRLTELQTIAFKSQFPAIEEFENKQQSAAFKIESMNAKLENQRVELGQNLAPAFMSAARAESFFLDRLEDIITAQVAGEEIFMPFIGSVIGLGNAYQKILQPTMDFGLNLMGTVVAIKTMIALQPQNIAAVQAQVKTYQQLAALKQLDVDMTALQNKGITTNTTITLTGLNRQQHSYQMVAVAARKKAEVERAGLFAKREEIKLSSVAALKALEEAKSKGEAAKAIKALNATVRVRAKQLDSVNKKLGQNLTNLRLTKQEKEFQAQITQRLNATRAEANLLIDREILAIQKSVAAQQNMANTLRTLGVLKANEVVLVERLDKSTRAGLVSKDAELAQAIEELTHLNALHHADTAGLVNDEKKLAKTRALIETNREKIIVLAEERGQVNALIMADDALADRQAMQTQTNNAATFSFKSLGAAVKDATFQKEMFTGAMLTGLLVIPALVDENKQMSAIMYGMALTTIPMLTKSFLNLTKAIRTTTKAGIVFSGGLGLVSMAIGAVAAFAGFKIFDSILGDNFETNIDDLETMNSELDRTSQILADLQGAAGGAPIMDSIFGSTTFNDLKQNAELTDQILADIATRIQSLNEDISLAMQEGEADAEAGFRQQIRRFETLEEKILAIDEAQNVVNQSNIFRQVSDVQSAEDFGRRVRTRGSDADATGYTFAAEAALSNLIPKEQHKERVRQQFRILVETAEGTYYEFFKLEKDAIARREELMRTYNEDNLTFTQEYYRDLLEVSQVGVDNLIANERYLYDSILEQQNEFANAREELFFGERANFTGQIYKQVVQGGVESLLHKVELVQHNVFNGMTLPEMVDAVSQGVLDELRSQGIVN